MLPKWVEQNIQNSIYILIKVYLCNQYSPSCLCANKFKEHKYKIQVLLQSTDASHLDIFVHRFLQSLHVAAGDLSPYLL